MMRAMVLDRPGAALTLREVAVPKPAEDELLLRILACGVCRTDLHILQGEVGGCNFPLILGHQIVGEVVEPNGQYMRGDRVGVSWLASICGKCLYCLSGRENLCEGALFTGCSVAGGFAEYAVAKSAFCFKIPEIFSDVEAAPLLCGGMIGYRAYKKAADAHVIGLYGFGSSAHLLLQLARFEGKRVYVFTKPNDHQAQELALSLGALWAGSSEEMPPEPLDAALLFAPVGSLVPIALSHVRPGGSVVCVGIHMSDIPAFAYRLLWGERVLGSVANLTRREGEEFLQRAAETALHPKVTCYPLEQAEQALKNLQEGRLVGSAVLCCASCM